MDAAFAPLRALLERTAAASRAEKDAHLAATEDRRSRDLARIVAARDAALVAAFGPADPADGTAAALVDEVLAYARRSDWNWIDVLLLLACADEDSAVCERLGRAGLLYQAFRMVDDLLDGHRDYKGRYPTLLAAVEGDPRFRRASPTALAVLPALAMVCGALDGAPPFAGFAARARRTVLGALAESLAGADTGPEAYHRIVDGKMVCYGFVLYGPAIQAAPDDGRAALEDFLAHSFVAAQVANDLADRADDRRRGQPNFWNLAGNTRAAVREFAEILRGLDARRSDLGAHLRPYGHARVHDIANYALAALDET